MKKELPHIPANADKEEVFAVVENFLASNKLSVSGKDDKRPWGGFFLIDENQAQKFAAFFFSELEFDSLLITQKLSPKILIVAPQKRLSWQYHQRRAEVWKLIAGSAKIITSETDEQRDEVQIQLNKTITLKQGERHRLIGADSWGIVAEIWQHTNHTNPSNEDDIIRLQDDFGREKQ
jgi:mannose-6-phosphate isomerase-like protein (cupin superfamily)